MKSMKYEIVHEVDLGGFIRLTMIDYNGRVFTGSTYTIDSMFFCHVEPVKIIGSWYCFVKVPKWVMI